jgi:hypothetical protein
MWPWGWLSRWQKWVPGIFLGGQGCRCVGLTTLPPSCADCLEILEPQPRVTLRACPGCNGIALPFITLQYGTGGNYTVTSCMICSAPQVLPRWSDQEEWDGLGVWLIWRRRTVHAGSRWGNLMERKHLEDIGIKGRIMLKWILQGFVWDGVDWIDLVQNGDRWRALVNTVMKLWAP